MKLKLKWISLSNGFSSRGLWVCPTPLPSPLPRYIVIGPWTAFALNRLNSLKWKRMCDIWERHLHCFLVFSDVISFFISSVGFTESSSIFWTQDKSTTWLKMDPCRGTLLTRSSLVISHTSVVWNIILKNLLFPQKKLNVNIIYFFTGYFFMFKASRFHNHIAIEVSFLNVAPKKCFRHISMAEEKSAAPLLI